MAFSSNQPRVVRLLSGRGGADSKGDGLLVSTRRYHVKIREVVIVLGRFESVEGTAEGARYRLRRIRSACLRGCPEFLPPRYLGGAPALGAGAAFVSAQVVATIHAQTTPPSSPAHGRLAHDYVGDEGECEPECKHQANRDPLSTHSRDAPGPESKSEIGTFKNQQ